MSREDLSCKLLECLVAQEKDEGLTDEQVQKFLELYEVSPSLSLSM
jgi:hypothetical protein